MLCLRYNPGPLKEGNVIIGKPQEALSTRCGGQGVVIFYGMAKPVRAPQIGPAQSP